MVWCGDVWSNTQPTCSESAHCSPFCCWYLIFHLPAVLQSISAVERQGTKHWNSHFSTFEQSFSWDGWRHQTMLQNRGTQTCQEQSWDCTCGRESRAAAIAANVGTSDSLKWAQMLKCRLWIFFETSKLWLKWIGISLSLNKHRLGGKLLAEGMRNQACSSSRFEK